MAILQVHQAKALKRVHEGSTDLGLMQELRSETDLALRAMKVTVRSLGKAMSTLVVQECHLWLNLAEMKNVDKARFLDAPISQGGLFGDIVEGFAQQFLASSRAAPPQAESTPRPARRASRRKAAPPAGAAEHRRCWSLLFLRRRREQRCSFPRRSSGWRILCFFLFLFHRWSKVSPAEMRQGFYSPYFIVPKKGGCLRPILDLRVLNRALHKHPFKMLTHRRMIKCIQPQDWFAAIDLKDAYFHVSILPRHRPFLQFAFEGQAWQYRVLPFGLSVSPCFHEGCRRRPYPVTGSGRQDPQLPRRLAHPGPIQRAVVRSQGLGASAPQPVPQPVGALGQLRK